MLTVATEREVEGDLLYADMGQGFGFRPGTFDAAISISAIQWLCTAESKLENPIRRIHAFFQSLFRVLVRGGRCVDFAASYRRFNFTLITLSRSNC